MKNATVNEISCSEAIARVAEYIDQHSGNMDTAALEHHIERCRKCFDRVEFERMLKNRLAAIRKPLNSETLRRSVESLLEKY